MRWKKGKREGSRPRTPRYPDAAPPPLMVGDGASLHERRSLTDVGTRQHPLDPCTSRRSVGLDCSSDSRRLGLLSRDWRAPLGGNALQGTDKATSFRATAGGFIVTDGPFVESKAVLGGYYLIEAADLGEAIASAKDVSMPHGGVEVRPIDVFGWSRRRPLGGAFDDRSRHSTLRGN